MADPHEGEKRPEGRPTLYRDEYPEQARRLCLLGYTDAEMATFFGVHVSTITEWKLVHAEFSTSMRAGKDVADADVAHSMHSRAIGAKWTEQVAVKVKTGQHTESVEIVTLQKAAPPDTNAGSLWLRNRRKNDWRDKVGDADAPPLDQSYVVPMPEKAKDAKTWSDSMKKPDDQ